MSSYIGQWREVIDHATRNVAVGAIWPQACLDIVGPIRPAFYAVSMLPFPAIHGAGALVFVTDGLSRPEMVSMLMA